MEPVDRLAAYLAGELTPEQSEHVRSSLASDPELARQLTALERADAALASLAPTAEPDGLAARLDHRLGPELAAQTSARDELAPRRRTRRPTPRWLPATAAAAVLAVAGTGVLLLGGDDLAEDTADTVAMERSGEPADAPLPEAGAGPLVVVDENRELDAHLADALLEDPAVLALAARALDPVAGQQLAAQVRDGLAGSEVAAMGEEPAAELAAPDAFADDAADEFADEFADELADELADVPEDPRQTLARCLEVVLAADPAAIPAYAELARFEGEPVVVLALVTPDAPGTAYTRSEIWVLSRDSCELRRFAQAE